jgi:glycosyltransferase involved in cell wall biosynthesis
MGPAKFRLGTSLPGFIAASLSEAAEQKTEACRFFFPTEGANGRGVWSSTDGFERRSTNFNNPCVRRSARGSCLGIVKLISVIVPHLDQPDSLASCLDALRSLKRPAQPVEIIVVDNGSKVPPTTICAAADGVTLLVQPTPGPGPARNLGASCAKGDILAFIDADCLAHPDWLCAIEGRFTQDDATPILGGDVRIACRDPHRPTLLESYESVFGYRMQEYIAKQGFTGTGNLAVRTAVFAAVGAFGGIELAEDRDWGQRALRLGYPTTYCPEMIVYHPARKSLAELAQKWQRHTAHDFVLYQSKPGWWPRWILRSMAVALSPVAELGRISFSDRLHGWRARCLALVGVVLIRLYRSRLMLELAFGGANATNLSGRWNRA